MSSTASPLVRFDTVESAPVRVTTLALLAMVGLLVGNLGRLPAFSTGERDAAVLLNDVFVAALLMAGAFAAVRRRSLRLDSVALLALAFATIGGLSTLWSIPRFGLSTFEVLVSLGYLARWLFYFGVYVVLINSMRSEDLGRVWSVMELVLVLFAVFGIVQSLTMPNFAQMVYPESRLGLDWDPQGHRLVSTWLDPVYAGAFLMIGLLMQLARVAAGLRVARWKPMLFAVALLLTASRAAVLALFVGIALVAVARGLSKRLIRMTVVLSVLTLGAAPVVLWFTGLFAKLTLDVSAMQRVIAWTRALQVFRDHPIIGVGFNAWGFVQERYGYTRLHAFSYSLDGGLIFVAVMTGLVGLAVYVAMLSAVLLRARRIWRDGSAPPEHRAFAIGAFASTIAVIVNGLFGNGLFLPFLMQVLWMLWAGMFAVRRPSYSPAARRRATTKKFVQMLGVIQPIASSSRS